MGLMRQNPIQRTVRTAHLSVLMTVHNFSTQYSTEQFSYLQTTIIAHTLSIGGKGGYLNDNKYMWYIQYSRRAVVTRQQYTTHCD